METTPARICVINIVATPGAGRLHALADVSLEIGGIEILIHGIQVRATADHTEVLLPTYRDHSGAWMTAITLPNEIKDGLADVVLQSGIDLGVLRERPITPE